MFFEKTAIRRKYKNLFEKEVMEMFMAEYKRVIFGVGGNKRQTSKVVSLFGKLIFGLAVRVVNYLLPFLQRYVIKVRVTFGLTNCFGIVGHDELLRVFGVGRELFGLNRIPGFENDVGSKYLLKTVDASFQHFHSFRFGDTIKMVVEVVEVNGASFKLRGRFLNKKTSEVYTIVYQTIVYTNTRGKPTRFPEWLKVLLRLSCVQGTEKGRRRKIMMGEDKLTDRHDAVSRNQVVVTSKMTNAEHNVTHNEYAKMLTQTVELFILSKSQMYPFEVEESYYRYNHDFFLGDEITIKLYTTKTKSKEDCAIFEANFLDKNGNVHAFGRQKIHFLVP